MLTSLDLLVIVFMVLAAATLLSLCLMFFIRNKTAQRVFFYITSVLGLYISSIGLRIGIGGMFSGQMIVGVMTVLICIGAFVLERIGKNSQKTFLIARVLSATALIVALANAFF